MLKVVAVSSLSLSAGLGLQDTPPVLPKDFYTGEQSTVSIVQGGYETTGAACCSVTDSPQCKIQFINEGSDIREQGSMNRTLGSSAQGVIVNWYKPVNKQMALIPGDAADPPSTHKWVCAQACPTDGDFVSDVDIGDGTTRTKVKDMGPFLVSQPGLPGGETKTCELYQWTTRLALLPLEMDKFYIDESGAAPVPFFKNQLIEPFGRKLATANISFTQFTPGDQSEFFDIDPDTVANCPPPEDGCGDDPDPPVPPALKRRLLNRKLLSRSYLSLAKEQAKKITAAADYKAPPPIPPPPNLDFGSDYSYKLERMLVMNQGGHMIEGGDYCCDVATSIGQCQIQLAHSAGTRYHDLTNGRARLEDTVAKATFVDVYGSVMKSMEINITNGVETCDNYCPIEAGDGLRPFDPFDPFDEVKDLGTTTWEGQTVQHYQWSDIIARVIKMETDDFYTTLLDTDPTTNATKAIPVFLQETISPLGQNLGSTNESFAEWTVGPQDPSKFVIAGVDVCPLSNQCGSSDKQVRRLVAGQKHSFFRYVKAPLMQPAVATPA